MIRNLKDTTQKNTEQDWLKTNLARFTGMLQGQRDMTTVANMILSDLAPLVDAQQGVFYVNRPQEEGQPLMKLLGGYAFSNRKHLANEFGRGEGLVGQCVVEKKRILLTNVPNDYIYINSGLGEASPLNIIVLPVLFEEEVKAVIELASFNSFSEIHMTFLNTLTESIGIVLNTIEANTRTERLLIQSQSLASELQSQQDELKKTNERLEQQALTLRESEERLRNQQEELRNTNDELSEKATLLAQQKSEVEASEVPFNEVTEQMNRSFHQLGQDKGLEFTIDVEPTLPPSILTDQKRLQQILKNLLSNAFKFTERGRVALQIKAVERRGHFALDSLNQADLVVGFSVIDTGIGIPSDKQQIIFETFQQADATTSRKYGGTGLGLSISREIARLLGGEIRVASVAGEGSTFTLYLPRAHEGAADGRT